MTTNKDHMKTAKDIFYDTRNFKIPISDEEKEIIKKDREVSYCIEYAIEVLKTRWIEAEPYILYHCENSLTTEDDWNWDQILVYTQDCIKSRWPELELVLLKSKNAARIYKYATRIIKNSWPEAEEILAENPEYANYYAQNILNSRFELAEENIAKSGYGLEYAMLVLKTRWPEAEKYTVENFQGNFLLDACEYAKEIMGGKWPELESAIINNSNLCMTYVSHIRQRWPEFEKRMLSLRSPQKIIQYLQFVSKIGEDLHNKMVMLSFSEKHKEKVNYYFRIIEERKTKHNKKLMRIKKYLANHADKKVKDVLELIEKDEYTHLAEN